MFVRFRYGRREIHPGNCCPLEYHTGDFSIRNPHAYSRELAEELEKHLQAIYPFTYITEVIDSNFRLQDKIKQQKTYDFGLWSYIFISNAKPFLLLMGFSSEYDMIMSKLII